MPIEQHRLYRLIQAAQTYLRRDRAIRAFAADICSQVVAGQITAQDAISSLSNRLSISAAYDRHEVIIQEEVIRYNLTHRRNVTEKLRMRARRAGEKFVPPNRVEPPPKLYDTPLTDIPIPTTDGVADDEALVRLEQARATRRLEDLKQLELNKMSPDFFSEYKRYYQNKSTDQPTQTLPSENNPNQDPDILNLDLDPDL